MRISRYSYYGDFVIYPLLVAGLGIAALARPSPEALGKWFVCFAIGLGVWTLAEYMLHRFVLHHVPYVKDMHDAHHDDEKALIGTPTWLSFIILGGGVLLPLYLTFDFIVMSGLAGGIVVGYLWYVTVHHMVHHWEVRPDGYGYRLKRRHALHHYFDDHGNFGVSSGFWDRVFGTNINVKTARARRRGT
jgi:sterol desaturase/sphingolipid hydroxylase (fatty acid hydroxylase superfamily)